MTTPGDQQRSGPPLSDDGRFWWDGQQWHAVPVAQSDGGVSPWGIARGILIAVIIVVVVLYVLSYFQS